ncbi:MAG: SCO family protein [Flavobacteriales bacterium]|nr:SCO family protein [Flavobacteriales bacterium]
MFTKQGYIKAGIFTLIFFTGVFTVYFITLDARTLPVYNPSQLNPDVVDESMRNVTKKHKIASFSLIDQEGETVTEKDFEGKIYVADFFFTTCQSICPKMSGQMQRLAEEFADDNDLKFISHTVYPEVDSVPLLKAYADEYGANRDKWELVTGDKKQIYDLARKSYFAVTTEGDGGEGDFIHTENFVLVDKEKRLRGFYDGTNPKEIDQLIEDINILKNEYAKKNEH